MKTLNVVFCEPYQKTGVESVAKKGLALGARQKISVAKLKALADAEVFYGTHSFIIKKGWLVLVNEESLHIGATGKQQMECEGVNGKFIVIDSPYIVGVDFNEVSSK
jgi:hypothetical protein